jgi:hypothetical protein
LQEHWDCVNEVEQIIAALVLPDLQGKGIVRKEAFLLTAFLVTFVATKVTGPPAAKSGYTPC